MIIGAAQHGYDKNLILDEKMNEIEMIKNELNSFKNEL
jgi:hypothetical protein